MLFLSYEFALLLLVVTPAYFALRLRRQNVLLLLASYVFYGWWDWRFLGLLATSTAVDFVVARRLEATARPAARRALLVTSCAINLGFLGFFKYWNLFAATGNGIGGWLGIEAALLPELRLVLPVGISFYTFQTLGYTIDVYRGACRASRSLLDFALYVSFFPQLVAGPIERAGRLLPAIQRPRRVSAADVEIGLFLFASGWFRKSLADVLAATADPAFARPEALPAWAVLWGIYAFAFQIYLDFSGYTDMARGVARVFGFRLMENFRAPYFSTNVREFWQRWHISLSTWLRDYLYIPLGGSRHGRFRTERNLVITMLLGGLWHGAAWTFAGWGLLHGLYLAAHRVWRNRTTPPARIAAPRRVLHALGTFHLVLFAWILFRVRPVGERDAFSVFSEILARLGDLAAEPLQAPPAAMWMIAVVLLLDWRIVATGRHFFVERWPWPARAVVLATLALAAFVVGSGPSEAFIYFQF